MSITCMIVDDEPIARKGIERYVDKVSFLELKHSLPDALSALEALTNESVELLILDVNMPGISGLQLLKALSKPPLAIITSAYPEHAAEGFELDVVDYIVKPVSFERFLKSINKAKEIVEARNKKVTDSPAAHFFIKVGNRIEKIVLADVLFIESIQNYVEIHTPGKKQLTLLSLKRLEEFLPANFVKVHKSYIVNVQKVDGIEGDELIIGHHTIPFSRANRDTVLKTILGDNLLRRQR